MSDTFIPSSIQSHVGMAVRSKRTRAPGVISWVAKDEAWVLVTPWRASGDTYYKRDEVECAYCADTLSIETDCPDIDMVPCFDECPCTYAYDKEDTDELAATQSA